VLAGDKGINVESLLPLWLTDLNESYKNSHHGDLPLADTAFGGCDTIQ
jgi:hypothetical protein